MKFFGLHWTSNDGKPVQVIIEAGTQKMWARSCPHGGEWTAWRRLDVNRNADGTLNETVANAIKANMADAAARLARAVNINLRGAVIGTGHLDGATDVYIETSITGITELEKRMAALDTRVQELAALEKRVGELESKVRQLWSSHNSGNDNNYSYESH